MPPPGTGVVITPAELRERFERTAGRDPIFRTNDGSNCEGAAVSTLAQRRRAFSLLLTRGVIRIGLEVPAAAEFDVVDVDDPYRCNAPLSLVSMFRRPLPTTNLKFLSTVMWDGRHTMPAKTIEEDLVAQTREAITGHAEGAPLRTASFAPSSISRSDCSPRRRTIISLAISAPRLHAAVRADRAPAVLHRHQRSARHAADGPGGVRRRIDRTGSQGLHTCSSAGGRRQSPERRAIARGEELFNTRQFVITGVPGLNGGAGDPVAGAIQGGTCTLCHDTPNAGNHSVSLPLNIGIVDASRRTPDLPLYSLRNRSTGEVVQVTDPGRAMITGKWRDVGKFKGPILRALAARPPYLHDGSAATLADVVDFYETRFGIGLSEREKADLLAFLRSL